MALKSKKKKLMNAVIGDTSNSYKFIKKLKDATIKKVESVKGSNDTKWKIVITGGKPYTVVENKKDGKVTQIFVKLSRKDWLYYDLQKKILAFYDKGYVSRTVKTLSGSQATFSSPLITARVKALRAERKKKEEANKRRTEEVKRKDKEHLAKQTSYKKKKNVPTLEQKYRNIAQKYLDTLVDSKNNLVIDPSDGMFFVKQIKLAITRFDGDETKINKYLNGDWKKNVQAKYKSELKKFGKKPKEGIFKDGRSIAELFAFAQTLFKEDVKLRF